MKIGFILGVSLFACALNRANSLHETTTDECLKKVEIFELLITSTYGPHNPFSELPLIIKSTYSRVRNLASLKDSIPETMTRYAAELEDTLNRINDSLAECITAYKCNTFREPILAKLITLCSISIDLLSQDPTTRSTRRPKKTRTKKTKQHRFIPFVSSSILVTAGKWIVASAASIWLACVLNKIYAYITLPNTDLIEETKINQISVRNTLIHIRNTLTPNIPHSEHTVTLDTSRWNMWGRWKQWQAQRKNAKFLAQHAAALAQLPHTETATHEINCRQWIATMTELNTAFPQQ